MCEHVAAACLPVDAVKGVPMFVFVDVHRARLRGREKSHCSVPPYLPSPWRACAISPLSDVTGLWYHTPSSAEITDHPKNTPLSTNSNTLTLCSPHLLWLTVSSRVSLAKRKLCQTKIPLGAS